MNIYIFLFLIAPIALPLIIIALSRPEKRGDTFRFLSPVLIAMSGWIAAAMVHPQSFAMALIGIFLTPVIIAVLGIIISRTPKTPGTYKFLMCLVIAAPFLGIIVGAIVPPSNGYF